MRQYAVVFPPFGLGPNTTNVGMDAAIKRGKEAADKLEGLLNEGKKIVTSYPMGDGGTLVVLE